MMAKFTPRFPLPFSEQTKVLECSDNLRVSDKISFWRHCGREVACRTNAEPSRRCAPVFARDE
jgi:hypothetical protein